MAGQIVKRGDRTWLVRVFLGRDPHTGKRRYHNHTIKGTKKDAQRYVNGVLRDIDMGSFVELRRAHEDDVELVSRPLAGDGGKTWGSTEDLRRLRGVA